jgi:hypothetical protein
MVLLQAIAGGSDMLVGTVVSILLCSVLALAMKSFFKIPLTIPISVNYHFTRKCNRVCGFCFHTEKVSCLTLSCPDFASTRNVIAKDEPSIM